jgi:hypothetical protein
MIKFIKRAIVYCVFLVMVQPSHSTSLVMKMEDGRIILAADTKGDTLAEGRTGRHDYRNDYCKIAALGTVNVAVTGSADYHQTKLSDPVQEWSALEDARTSFRLHANNLEEVADDWGRRALAHYQAFYSANRARVTSLAALNRGGILIQGLFVGWDGGLPTAVVITVRLSQRLPSKASEMLTEKSFLARRDLPYSTNDHTLKLIEGDSKEKRAVAARWVTVSRKLPKSELDWRWVEFLIKSTSRYDETVGQYVDVLEVLPGGSVWLQNSSCPVH